MMSVSPFDLRGGIHSTFECCGKNKIAAIATTFSYLYM